MDARTDWWKNFFSGLFVDFWRAAMTEEATRAEAGFLEKHLKLRPGARVLDVPCGDGRLSLELAARGYRMTGADLSSGFLRAAGKGAKEQGLAVDWHKRDMRKLPWRSKFDAAFCVGNSFGYFDDAGNANFLKAVARALRPGCRFILDAPSVAESLLPNFRDRIEAEVGNIRFLAENRYDHRTGRIQNRYTVTRGNKSNARRASHRIYTYHQVVGLLEEAGFSEHAAYGSLSGEPFRLGLPRLLLVAAKKS